MRVEHVISCSTASRCESEEHEESVLISAAALASSSAVVRRARVSHDGAQAVPLDRPAQRWVPRPAPKMAGTSTQAHALPQGSVT